MDNKNLIIGYTVLLVFILMNVKVYEHMNIIPVEQHIAAGMANVPNMQQTGVNYSWSESGPLGLSANWQQIHADNIAGNSPKPLHKSDKSPSNLFIEVLPEYKMKITFSPPVDPTPIWKYTTNINGVWRDWGLNTNLLVDLADPAQSGVFGDLHYVNVYATDANNVQDYTEAILLSDEGSTFGTPTTSPVAEVHKVESTDLTQVPLFNEPAPVLNATTNASPNSNTTLDQSEPVSTPANAPVTPPANAVPNATNTPVANSPVIPPANSVPTPEQIKEMENSKNIANNAVQEERKGMSEKTKNALIVVASILGVLLFIGILVKIFGGKSNRVAHYDDGTGYRQINPRDFGNPTPMQMSRSQSVSGNQVIPWNPDQGGQMVLHPGSLRQVPKGSSYDHSQDVDLDALFGGRKY